MKIKGKGVKIKQIFINLKFKYRFIKIIKSFVLLCRLESCSSGCLAWLDSKACGKNVNHGEGHALHAVSQNSQPAGRILRRVVISKFEHDNLR